MKKGARKGKKRDLNQTAAAIVGAMIDASEQKNATLSGQKKGRRSPKTAGSEAS